MLTLKMPFETMDTVDIIDAVLEGTIVDVMKIEQNITDKYRFLVDLHNMCTNTNPEERPSIDQIIKELVVVASHGNVTLRVERKPSLVEQLNKYNLAGNSRAAVDREPNLDFEMEAEISRATSSTVKFGGPQNHMDPNRRFPAPLGLSSDRDAILQNDDITESETTVDDYTEESKVETPESTATIARLQRSMSKFGGFVDPRKRKKGKLEMKKRGRRPSNANPDDTTVASTLPIKRPKRNTISKTTLQKMVDEPDVLTS